MVTTNNIFFPLNPAEQIVVILERPLEDVLCCDESSILFVQKKEESIVLSKNTIYEDMNTFCTLLKQVLANNALVHKSIDNDIGYLYNQYSYSLCVDNREIKEQFIIETIDNSRFWIGMRYSLWSGKDSVSWMYNDDEDNIIFAVTPVYPHMYEGAEEEPSYVPYKEWIKSYKPYLIRKIPKQIAQKWLEDANAIVEQINTNIAQWREEEEE